MTRDQIIQNALKAEGQQAFWMRVYKRYHRAQLSRAAKEAGIIGVGLLTDAAEAMGEVYPSVNRGWIYH